MAVVLSDDNDRLKTMPGLTDKQRRFVAEYAQTGKAKHSACLAGYSEATASQMSTKLLNNPKVAGYLRELQGQLERDREGGTMVDGEVIDADWVLRESVRLYKGSMALGDMRSASGALDKIGKHRSIGAFVEKHEVTTIDWEASIERLRRARDAVLEHDGDPRAA